MQTINRAVSQRAALIAMATLMQPVPGTAGTMTAKRDYGNGTRARIRLSSTVEILEFTPIGGAVPNRGSCQTFAGSNGQDDVIIFGLRYLQRIADAVTHEALHIEPGFWLNVPATQEPDLGPTVIRLGTFRTVTRCWQSANHCRRSR